MAKTKTLMSWSTGKDSAWATYQLMQDPEIELVGLICSINQTYQRTAMHAVRRQLLETQAKQLGLNLQVIELPSPCSNAAYESIMQASTTEMQATGAIHVAYGDLFLEDIKAYRIRQMTDSGLTPVFPIWQTPTDQLAVDLIEHDFKAIVTCIDPKQLDASFVGRAYDQTFLDDLPSAVDPCGENGEFHTFVYSAPIFAAPIPVEVGEIVERGGFVFADLLPCASLPCER